MQLVTVGTKYQIVIPKNNRISVEPQPKSWVKRTAGIAKEAWKGIDTTKYLAELRNEWDPKY